MATLRDIIIAFFIAAAIVFSIYEYAHAQVIPAQNQVTSQPFGGIVYATSTSGTAKLYQLFGAAFGDIPTWNGTKWVTSATSSLFTFPWTVAQGGTGKTTFTSSQLLYGNGTNALSSVATGTVSSGAGISVTGGQSIIGSGLTITNTSPLSSLTTAFPLSLSGTVLSWIGLATTSNPTAGNLFYSNGTNGLVPIGTTTVTCAGSTSCTTFTIPGSTPITITGSGGGGTGLSTSSPLSAGNLLEYSASGAGSAFGVATGTVSNGSGISVTAGQSVIGSGLTITNTGVLSLQQLGGGTAQTGALTFNTTTDSFNGLQANETITNSGAAFTFANNITGVLTNGGGGTGTSTPGIPGQNIIIDPTGLVHIATSSLFVASNQNVGIGTTSPQSTLDVSGLSTNTTFSTFGNPTLSVTNLSQANNTFGRLAFRTINTNGSATSSAEIYGIGTSHGTSDKNSGNLAFSVLRVGALSEAARFDALGEFGIGTSAPSSRLHVDTGTSDLETPMYMSGNVNDFQQLLVQNSSAGANASTGFAACNNEDGQNTGCPNHYIQFGIDGSGFTGEPGYGFLIASTTAHPFQFTNINAASDWQFLTQGNPGTLRLEIAAGGNVGVASGTPWKLLSVGTNNTGTFAISTSTAGCATFSALGELYSTGVACGTGGGGGGSGNVATSSSETANEFPYWSSNSATPATLAGTSNLFRSGTNIGVGTSSPFASFSISTTSAGSASSWLFDVASSTAATLFNILSSGFVGIGTSSPKGLLGIQSISNAQNVFTVANSIGSTTVEADTVDTGAETFLVASSSQAANKFEFAVDKVGHLMTGGTAPTCGTGCTSVSGDDNTFRAVTGSGVTAVTVNFANTWRNSSGTAITPVCNSSDESGGTTVSDASSTPTSVTMNLSASLTSKNLAVSCIASDNFTQ